MSHFDTLVSDSDPDSVILGSRWLGVIDTFVVVEIDGDDARLAYENGYDEGPWWEKRQDIVNAFTYLGGP